MGRKERYPSVEENGEKGAERIAAMYRGKEGVVKVTIEHTQIPQWGSGDESSSTFVNTELGYMVTVEYADK